MNFRLPLFTFEPKGTHSRPRGPLVRRSQFKMGLVLFTPVNLALLQLLHNCPYPKITMAAYLMLSWAYIMIGDTLCLPRGMGWLAQFSNSQIIHKYKVVVWPAPDSHLKSYGSQAKWNIQEKRAFPSFFTTQDVWAIKHFSRILLLPKITWGSHLSWFHTQE